MPIILFAIWTIAPYTLSSLLLWCETNIRTHVMRLVHYAHFSLNKFESLSITLWYNVMPSVTFEFLAWISLTNIAIFISILLEHREPLLTFTCIRWKCYIFGPIGHIWSLKTIIKSLSLSLSLTHTFSVKEIITWLSHFHGPSFYVYMPSTYMTV